MSAFHPDRDGCDCEEESCDPADECPHDDPCWVSEAAYRKSRAAVAWSLSIRERVVELALEYLTENGWTFGYEVSGGKGIQWWHHPDADQAVDSLGEALDVQLARDASKEAGK